MRDYIIDNLGTTKEVKLWFSPESNFEVVTVEDGAQPADENLLAIHDPFTEGEKELAPAYINLKTVYKFKLME